MAARSPLPVGPSPQIPEEEAALWDACKLQNSAKARERLFLRYLPLAKRISARFVRDNHSTPVEFQELSQMASTGLLEAIDNFNPALGVPFRFYCPRRISGSILNGLAKLSEVNHQISLRKRLARERLRSISHDNAKPKKIDDALDILGDIAAELALGMMLDSSAIYQESERDPAKDAYDTLVWKQAIGQMRRELEALPERDRDVLRYHYLESMGFDEIGNLLGVTKGRISQIHKAAIALLRKRVSNNGRFRLEG
ncbi:MAG: sigma-70 family RNA polymerase sigma factor [Sphingorhabdus sp.]|jgi:RNA polymerase sigma factor for flagellar operon FliA|uniref:sigma-70 family RNA polymerase sigma factor n=1 Tax=Sphingorhabdus sp. TaxID=1902408 RepID=UPI0025E133C0|nr:sigma-70 family RNA polymerase sigma factor [Sphingorhabdus sp.]MCO4091458.1 sigma-70 family RNA polymerase sigma factor [Sphingorhabdus sp.]